MTKAMNNTRTVFENRVQSRYIPAANGKNQHGYMMAIFFLKTRRKLFPSFLSKYLGAITP
jgi:hypothetical protein